MPKLRVHNLAISLDGYAAGPNQSRENPLGVGGPGLHEWVFATRSGRQMDGQEGGEEGLDDEFLARGDKGIGATIMGRNMFGPIGGPWTSEEWTGFLPNEDLGTARTPGIAVSPPGTAGHRR
jgi:dihydrofolate reductase